MGFFSQLDIEVMDLVVDGYTTEEIHKRIAHEYNGLVSRSTVDDAIHAVYDCNRPYEPSIDFERG
jgi:hypothetical protein